MFRSSVRDDRPAGGLRVHLRPLAGGRRRRPARGAPGRARGWRCWGEASHGTHEFYAERRRLSQRLIRDTASMPWWWKPTGRMRGASTATSAAARTTASAAAAVRLRALPDLDVAQHGDGGLRRVAARAQPRPAGLAPGAASTAWTCTACTPRSRRCWTTWTDVDPRRRGARAAATACFDHFGEDSQAYGYAASFGMKSSCEDEVIQQLREMNGARPTCWPAPARTVRPVHAQQNARWCATRRSTTAPCSTAGSRPGTCGTATWWRRCRRWRSTWPADGRRPHGRVGAQLASGRRERDRDGRHRRVERGPAGARPLGRGPPCWWASARTTAR
jgi:hypothetical protein